MNSETLYNAYPADVNFMKHYAELQERYFRDARQSDLVLASLVGAHLDRAGRQDLSLLDIGCSTGALLYHMQRAFPALKMIGGDLSEQTIARCRQDARLDGIPFEIMDILNLKRPEGGYDIVVANAIFYGFSPRLFADALANIAKVLNPGGCLIAFDYFHPYRQDVEIVEYSETFPEGHPLHYRSFETVSNLTAECGFDRPAFMPFDLPLDLPHPGYDSVHTRTETLSDGKRLQFRGCLSQPWCHMSVIRP